MWLGMRSFVEKSLRVPRVNQPFKKKGLSLMEQDLVKRFKTAEKRTLDREITQESYPEDDVKQIVHDVLEELKRRNVQKTKEGQ